MTSADKCARCAGTGTIPKFRRFKYAGHELCPQCDGTGKRHDVEESLRAFRKRVIENK